MTAADTGGQTPLALAQAHARTEAVVVLQKALALPPPGRGPRVVPAFRGDTRGELPLRVSKDRPWMSRTALALAVTF